MEKVVVVVEEENVVEAEEVVAVNKGEDIPESPFCDNNCKKSIISLINESRKKSSLFIYIQINTCIQKRQIFIAPCLGLTT